MTLAASLLAVAAFLTLTMPPNAVTRTLRRPRERPAAPAAHVPFAAALLALVTLGPAAAAAVVGVVAAARGAARRRAAAALARANAAALPGVCRAVAAELRAGAPPATALARAADDAPPALGTHLRRVAAAAQLGTDPPPDLWVAAPGTARLDALAALWSVAAGSGAGLADGVERLAGALSAEHRLRADTAAQLAGPRASATVLAALPLLGLALAAALGARPLAFLTSPLGFACLAGAVALNATGVWWVRRLTRLPSLAAPR